MAKTLSEELAERAAGPDLDLDPENYEEGEFSDSSSSSEVENKTEHYVQVDKSRLRDDGIALTGGKYTGSRVSRSALTKSEDEVSGDEEEEEDEEETKFKPKNVISKILSDEQKLLLTRLTTEKNSDVAKGKAVADQMKMGEKLLDLRIQTQKILSETNKLTEPSTEENPLLPLISTVLNLRSKLTHAEPIASESSLDELADVCAKQDAQLRAERESVLTKWSAKVALSSGNNAMNKLSSLNQSAANQVNNVLNDMDRLVQRTQTDRTQASLNHPFLFDDADFYRLLLKDLVDKRMADTANATEIKWKVSKSKKKVDTKASKGRKLRYTVIDKIQGFDAPRRVYRWSEKQAEDLYAGLLGVSLDMTEAQEPQPVEKDEIDLNIRVGNDFALFG